MNVKLKTKSHKTERNVMKLLLILLCLTGVLLFGCDGSPATNLPETVTTSLAETTAEMTTGKQDEDVVVQFECPELERLVREKLDKPIGDITSIDMLELYDIRPNGEKISSLVGLEYAENLSDFGILRNEIELDSLVLAVSLFRTETVTLIRTGSGKNI